MVRIAVIGGGPVGTSCACLLKTSDSSLEVHVFEQRPAFTRNQILLLSKETLKILPGPVINTIVNHGCYVGPPPTDSLGRCYRDQNSKGTLLLSVKISILEDALWNYAKSVGVIVHRPVAIPGNNNVKDQILITDPRLEMFDIIIGAGGRNDIVRDYLKIPIKETPISNAIIFTWTPEQNSTFHRQSRRRKSGSQDRYRFFRSPDTNYYGTVQLSPKETKEISTLPTTGTIDMIESDSILRSFGSLLKFYNISPDELPHHTDQKSEVNYTLVPVSLYNAEDYVGFKALPGNLSGHKKIFIILGDAVLGVHFFSGTGVNSGINMAHVVTEEIITFLNETNASMEDMNDMFDVIRDEFDHYIDKALEKSINVVIPFRKVGKCKNKTIKELRKMAKKYRYSGITTLPKHEMCMIMTDHLF